MRRCPRGRRERLRAAGCGAGAGAVADADADAVAAVAAAGAVAVAVAVAAGAGAHLLVRAAALVARLALGPISDRVALRLAVGQPPPCVHDSRVVVRQQKRLEARRRRPLHLAHLAHDLTRQPGLGAARRDEIDPRARVRDIELLGVHAHVRTVVAQRHQLVHTHLRGPSERASGRAGESAREGEGESERERASVRERARALTCSHGAEHTFSRMTTGGLCDSIQRCMPRKV